jgi:hypothetical protein
MISRCRYVSILKNSAMSHCEPSCRFAACIQKKLYDLSLRRSLRRLRQSRSLRIEPGVFIDKAEIAASSAYG